jgi:opacity protein-like surface antigen
MKNSLQGGALAVVFAGLLLLAAPTVSYGATTTFNLNIPSRMGLPRTARIRITLELSGPASGASLAFNNGMETVNTVGVPAGATFANKDDIFLNAPAGMPNTIVILYSPFSRFTENPPPNQGTFNLCAPNAGMNAPPEEQTIAVTLDGPTINAFRITSYTVAHVSNPNDPNDPVLECGNAVRRAKNFAATLSTFSGTAPTNKGRHPLDVILVLDNSGSMSSPPPDLPAGYPPDSKWTYLKNGVSQFISVWAQSDLANTGGSDLANDRIGVVFFSTTADPANFATMGNPATIFKARGNAPGSDWDAVNMAVNGKGPTDMTAMGLGLQSGIDNWFPLPAPKNDATIVLMTDGIQNVAPLITPEMGTGILQLDPPGAPPVKNLYTYGIPILTVAFGSLTPGSTYTQLLNNLSVQTAGASLITTTPGPMEQSFSTQLVNALKGSTLSINSRAEGVLPAGSNVSAPHQAVLDGSVKRAIVVLGWPSGAGRGLDLQFIPPGATNPVAPVARQDGATWTTQSIDIPQSGSIGDWTIRAVRKSSAPGVLSAAASTQVSVPYHLSVYAVEGRLDYRLSFAGLKNGTGDSLVVKAEVSFDGKPLSSVAEGIKLTIERPNEGLGNIMHKPIDIPAAMPNATDTSTPYDRKLKQLVEREGLLAKVSPTPLPTQFVMRDDGNAANGDDKAGDGIYAAQLTDTSRPGLYRFKVALDWTDPRTGRIHRIETLEREVKVKPDAAMSEVSVDTQRGSSDHLITITPRDKFRNYLGPGYPALISVQSSAGNVGTVDDAQVTGNYVVPLTNVPPGTNPSIKIVVDGVTIRDKTLSGLGGSTGPFTPGGGTIPADAADKRWGLSLHAGANFPHAEFNDFFDSGFSFNADLEYRLSNHFSFEALYGYHRFPTEFFSDHADVHQLSGNVKVFGGSSTVRPFINGGGGIYHLSAGGGGETKGGANLGGGLQFNITPTFAIEGAYNFHTVFTPGPNLKFSTLQGGVRFRF